jgi:hypothetical protein
MNDNNISEIDQQINEKLDTVFLDKLTTYLKGVKDVELIADQKIFDVNLQKFWKSIFDNMGLVQEDDWMTILTPYVSAGFLTAEQANSIYKLKDTMKPLNMFLWIAMAVKLFSSVLEVNTDSAQAMMSYTLNKKLRPGMPSYRDIINSAFIAPEKTGEVREIMKKSGIRDEDIDLLFISMYRLYDENMIRTLFFRGVLTESQMVNRLQELGYTETRIKELVQAWDIIPGPQDLLTMVAHEAFEPDSIQLMGLDDEFPTEQVEWLKKQGLSEFWARKYWISHWEQPSIQMGYEMLHRGQIGLPELDLLYRTVEIPKFWRDKLTAIAYTPLTRVDVRRMHKIGVLDEQGVFNSYKAIGFNDEHAGLMTKFTVEYNQGDDKELTKGEVLKSYKKRAIDHDTAKSLLMQVHYDEDTAEYYLEFADYEVTLDMQDQQVDNIKNRYINRLITRSEAQQQLDALDLPSPQVKLYLEQWDITLFKNTKLPSKDDLKKFIQARIINADQFRQEMDKLGYSYQYADWYLQLALAK